MLAISLAEVFANRSRHPDSFIRFPSISAPIKGIPMGATRAVKSVTRMGNRTRVVRETDFWTLRITIFFSRSVVKNFMIGG